MALYHIVAQELAYAPTTFASPSGGRLSPCRRDRRVHTDDTRLERPQHLASAERLVEVGPSSTARQHQPAADQLGDATEPDDEPGCDVATGFDSTKSERAVDESDPHDPVDRYDRNEGEDALTG